MNRENIEREIREIWFKDHRATLTKHGNITVLDWREPGTCIYAVRYVFDGSRIYITGDIGEAVFRLTWEADVHSFNDIHIGYFYKKLQAYSGDKMDFDENKAVKKLKEWKYQLDEDGYEYDIEDMQSLIKAVWGCSSVNELAHEIVNDRFSYFISELDTDYWEWIYNIGDVIPWRVQAYLIGLKMASEQLKGESN